MTSLTVAEELAAFLTEKSLVIAAAESCTGGLVADSIVRIPGASKVFWGSFVCYTVEAKINMLGTDREILDRYGPVSSEAAAELARRALEKSGAHGAVSVTGFAGPDGEAGTVWIGTAVRNGGRRTEKFAFSGLRNEIREKAAREAVYRILKHLQEFF